MAVGEKRTSLDDEVVKVILKNKRYFVFPKIKSFVHTPEDDIEIPMIDFIHIYRDFDKNVTDEIYIDFHMPAGTYLTELLPNKDQLEITLIFKYEDSKPIKKRFKFIILDINHTELLDTLTAKFDPHEKDFSELRLVKGQCVDAFFMQAKNATTSGAFHNVNQIDLAKALINDAFKDIKVNGEKIKFKINAEKPTNNKKYKNLIIKPFTKVLNIPKELHENGYGTYDSEIGIYFTNIYYGKDKKPDEPKKKPKPNSKPEHNYNSEQNNYNFHIYAKHDFSKIDKNDKGSGGGNLILLNGNMEGLRNDENDFFYEDGAYKLVIDKPEFKDLQAEQMYNQLTSIAKQNVNNLMDQKNFNITDNKISHDASKVNSVTIGHENIYSYNKVHNTNLDNNHSRYTSQSNRNKGILGIFTVVKKNLDFIHPAMATKYIFNDKGKTKDLKGVVQYVDYYYDNRKGAIIGAIGVMFDKSEVQKVLGKPKKKKKKKHGLKGKLKSAAKKAAKTYMETQFGPAGGMAFDAATGNKPDFSNLKQWDVKRGI